MIKTLAAIIFPLITFPYTSRVLHPQSVGKINFGASIVNYFILLATLGITTYAVRECSRVKYEKKSLEKVASQIFSINICTMMVSYAVLIICLLLVPSLKGYELLIAIQSASIFFIVIGADWMNTAMEDFTYITIRTLIFQVLSIILMFMFVRSQEDFIKLAIINVVSSSGANICNVFYRRKYGKVKFVLDMDWKCHFPPVLLLFAMMVAQSILQSVDVTMLGIMKGDYEVGLYTTATKIIAILVQVITSIAWVIMPQLSYEFAHENYSKINELLKGALSFSVVLGLPCIVGLNVLTTEIIEIIAGKEYLGAATCLHISTISMGFSILSGIFGNMILLPARREKQFTIACITGTIVNIIANAILIPFIGINGAAIATAFSSAVILIISMLSQDKEIHFNGICEVVKAPIIGSAGICLIGLLVHMLNLSLLRSVGIVISTSVVFYLIVLIVLKNSLAMKTIIPIFNKIFRK